MQHSEEAAVWCCLGWAKENDEDREARWKRLSEKLAGLLAGVATLSARVIADPDLTGIPVVEIQIERIGGKLSGTALLHQLRSGSPRIEVNPWRPAEGILILSPACLREDDPPAIAERLKQILGTKTPRADAPASAASR